VVKEEEVQVTCGPHRCGDNKDSQLGHISENNLKNQSSWRHVGENHLKTVKGCNIDDFVGVQ
jgi:hypothetical protein